MATSKTEVSDSWDTISVDTNTTEESSIRCRECKAEVKIGFHRGGLRDRIRQHYASEHREIWKVIKDQLHQVFEKQQILEMVIDETESREVEKMLRQMGTVEE